MLRNEESWFLLRLTCHLRPTAGIWLSLRTQINSQHRNHSQKESWFQGWLLLFVFRWKCTCMYLLIFTQACYFELQLTKETLIPLIMGIINSKIGMAFFKLVCKVRPQWPWTMSGTYKEPKVYINRVCPCLAHYIAQWQLKTQVPTPRVKTGASLTSELGASCSFYFLLDVRS